MERRVLKNSRGDILILTILIVSLMVTLTLQFNTSMWSELHAASNLKDGLRLGSIARSGFDFALAVLSEDAAENDFDSLHETWSDSEALSDASATMFDNGSLKVMIEDHSGKIQINRIVNSDGKGVNQGQIDLLTRFLSSKEFHIDPEEVNDIVDAIKDWIDSDDEVTDFGAESTYYQSLDRPYDCRNGPMESLEELLLVKGISRELFFGTTENPGISKYLSIHGKGKININTADPLILRALLGQDNEDLVQSMVTYREDDENDLSSSDWYISALGPNEDILDKRLVSTRSSHFEIKSLGMKDTMSKGVRGIVERDKTMIRILSWRVP